MADNVYAKELKLSIGGIGFSIDPVDNITFDIGDAQRYFVSDSAPDLRLSLRNYAKEAVRLIPEEKIFDSGGIWDLYRSDGDYIFNCYFDDFGRTPHRTAVVNKDFTSGDIYLNKIKGDPGPSYPINYPLDEILMVQMLARGRGAMVHGCGLIIGSEGFLFVGSSGRGKSTISQILKKETGAVILNDDRIIVRREGPGGAYRIYGTPWHGDVHECSSGAAPLKRIFFIRHAPANSFRRLNSVETAARLVSCSFSPLWDKDGMKIILEFLSGIAEEVPAGELGFLPDGTIAQFLKTIQ